MRLSMQLLNRLAGPLKYVARANELQKEARHLRTDLAVVRRQCGYDLEDRVEALEDRLDAIEDEIDDLKWDTGNITQHDRGVVQIIINGGVHIRSHFFSAFPWL